MTLDEAEAAIAMMFDGAFGSAGTEVVIEEFLAGREISFFALCDGETAIPLATAQDHKRVFDHDEGPNTGGMGAYSPTPFVTAEIHDQIMARIILPTVAGMKARGTPFRGVLYAGVMLTEQGPKLFEYNVRFGDPECQVLMLRMMSDIVPAFLAACDGELKHFDLRWYPEPALTVVMAAKGYPGDYKKGTRIEGLDDAAKIEGVEIFHAGTVAKDGAILANGGRVLNVCAMGKTVLEAQQRAYAGRRPHQMAGWFLPPRHRLAGGGAGEGEGLLDQCAQRRRATCERGCAARNRRSMASTSARRMRRQASAWCTALRAFAHPT